MKNNNIRLLLTRFFKYLQNLNELLKKLRNIAEIYEVPHNMFNHIDYLWARDVKTLLNDKLVELLASSASQ